MSQQHEQLAEDIRFIFQECGRITDMGADVFKILPKNEAFFTLPHPSGKGEMLCGRAAEIKVKELADEAGRRSGLSRRVSHQTLRKPTKDLLVQRFCNESRELSRKEIDRFLASVGRQAKVVCLDITHFIPCTLMTAQDPEELRVGPVVFRNRASFRRRMLVHLNGYGKDAPEDWQRERARQMMADAAIFYRQFDWVAEVTVKGCDSETSALIAERTVTSALDCLHLIFQAKNSGKMRVGGPALRADRRARVTIGRDEKMHPHGSTSWAGQGNFPEGWSKQLKDPHLSYMLSLCSLALEVAVDPDLARPISRRFLDAAQWFGEASRDDRSATRVVKYVTAIERMVMTEEKNDITKLVSERVAALCCDSKASDRQKWREDTTHIYNLRSRLVHGSMSPADPKIEDGVWLAAHIGEQALLSALGELQEDALQDDKASPKQLAKWYSRVIEYVDRLEAAARSEF